MRENVVGLMQVVAEEVGMDLSKMDPATAAMEVAEYSPLNLSESASSAHFMRLVYNNSSSVGLPSEFTFNLSQISILNSTLFNNQLCRGVCTSSNLVIVCS